MSIQVVYFTAISKADVIAKSIEAIRDVALRVFGHSVGERVEIRSLVDSKPTGIESRRPRRSDGILVIDVPVDEDDGIPERTRFVAELMETGFFVAVQPSPGRKTVKSTRTDEFELS